MSPRENIENTWPDKTGIDDSLLEEGRESSKTSGSSRSRSSRSLTSISSSGGATSGNSGSGKSKNGTNNRTPSSTLGTPTPGSDNRRISPEEISGEAPDAPERTEETEIIMTETDEKYADTSVKPMGFMNGEAPEYATSICYRNAAITMLLNLPFFTNWLAQGYGLMRQEGPDTTMDAMSVLAAKYWSQLTAKRSPSSRRKAIKAKQQLLDVAMDGLWNRFLEANGTFTPNPITTNFYCQEDAALFLSTLLESAHDELDPISINGNVLDCMFRAWLTTTTYCSGGCQKKRKRRSQDGQPVLNLPNWIHIVNFQSPKIRRKGARSFQECFDASLEQQQESNCPRCGRPTRRSAKDKFVVLPKILLTQLNRSTNTQGKIQDHCQIPRELIVALDESVRSKYKDQKYRLAAVVAHSGESSISGHYISYVRDPARPGSWIELDDNNIRHIDFAEINHNQNPHMKGMLPYIMAWELVDLTQETAAGAEETEAADGNEVEARKRQLDESEVALYTQWETLNEKEVILDAQLEMLNEREEELGLRKEELDEENRKLIKKALDLYRGKEEKKQALDKREADLEERERRLQVEKEVDDLFENSGHGNDSRSPSVQPAVQAKDQIAHEVDEGKDTATFCATFRNSENHDDTARAIFKLSNFKPNVATKIESSVQLTDLEGNLRSIKKGTTVNDDFIIIFNVKGGKKRKRDDDDEAGPPPPAPKKTRRQPKQAKKLQTPPQRNEEPQTSPTGKKGSPVAKKPTSSPKANERKSPQTTEGISRRSPPPPPRRSTRINKGMHPKRA